MEMNWCNDEVRQDEKGDKRRNEKKDENRKTKRMRFKLIHMIEKKGRNKRNWIEKSKKMIKMKSIRKRDETMMRRMKLYKKEGRLECSSLHSFYPLQSLPSSFSSFPTNSTHLNIIPQNMSSYSSSSFKCIQREKKEEKRKKIYFQNEQEERKKKRQHRKEEVDERKEPDDGKKKGTKVERMMAQANNHPLLSLFPPSIEGQILDNINAETEREKGIEERQVKNEHEEKGCLSAGHEIAPFPFKHFCSSTNHVTKRALSHSFSAFHLKSDSCIFSSSKIFNIPHSFKLLTSYSPVTSGMLNCSKVFSNVFPFSNFSSKVHSAPSRVKHGSFSFHFKMNFFLHFILNLYQIQTISSLAPLSQSTNESQSSSMIMMNLNKEKADEKLIEGSDKFKSQLLVRHNLSCRTEEGYKLPLEQYSLETCAKCYFYLPDWAFKPNSKLRYLRFGFFIDLSNNETFLANDTINLSKTFLTNNMVQKWQECCQDAIDCCVNHLSHTASPNEKQQSIGEPQQCPRTWDGWSCWPSDVTYGATVKKPCPAHIYWKITVPPCRGYVTKKCGTNGDSWFLKDGREWSNYTTCARDDIYIRRLRYSIITHLISVSFIIPALVIFNYYRQLSSQPRIRLHKHLFTSLVLYAILSSLLKLNLLLTKEDEEDSLNKSNSSSNTGQDYYCLILSLSLRYFRSTCYLWMFNEAFYLYQLIKRAFSVPPVGPLIALAYGVPLVMTISYIVCRSILTSAPVLGSVGMVIDTAINESSGSLINRSLINETSTESIADDDYCWMLPAKDNWTEWVINGPNLCILLINCTLLIPIVREIYKKAAAMPSSHGGPSHGNSMRVSNSESVKTTNNSTKRKKSILNRLNTEDEASMQKKLLHRVNSPGNSSKASLAVSLRAATLLLPLYGLHYLVIVYRPDVDICWLSELYHYLSLTLDGLQGSLVSLLFCFGNNEVRALLKKSLFKKRDSSLYMTEVVPNPAARNSPLVLSKEAADKNFNSSIRSATKI